MHILCIDDEQFIRNLLHYNFKKLDFKCTVCSNGYEAIQIVKTTHVDLVITDLMLPQINGFQLIQRLKHIKDDLPIILLTAKKTEDDFVNGFELGIEDYLTKPFMMKELNIKVQKILERHVKIAL